MTVGTISAFLPFGREVATYRRTGNQVCREALSKDFGVWHPPPPWTPLRRNTDRFARESPYGKIYRMELRSAGRNPRGPKSRRGKFVHNFPYAKFRERIPTARKFPCGTSDWMGKRWTGRGGWEIPRGKSYA